MKKFFLILFMSMLLTMGMAGATDSAITGLATLTGQNTYATEAYWSAAPTGSNTAYIAYDGAYDYMVAINATTVGTSPKLNILAGTNPPAFRAGIGNLAISLTANRTIWVGPLESARFLNATGYLKFSTTNVTTAKMLILKVA